MKMDKRITIRCFAGPRKWSLDDCANAMWRLLKEFGNIDPAYADWYVDGRQSKQACVTRSKANLRRLLGRGVNRDDVAHKPIENLGFSICLWHPNDSDSVGRLIINWGVSTPYVENSCILDPPPSGRARQRLLSKRGIVSYYASLARCFDPDHGDLASGDLWDEIHYKVGDPPVGWVTYMSRRLGSLPELKRPTIVVPIDDLGHLIFAVGRRFSAQNREHVDDLLRVREVLNLNERIDKLKCEETNRKG